MNTRLFLLAAPIRAYPFTHMFNLTLVSENISEVQKAAHVLPLHKGGDIMIQITTSQSPNCHKIVCHFQAEYCNLNPH